MSGAADRNPLGLDIFRQRCAKCHGRNGEGVNGKYDGPLQGDRPLDKLTRYIERNMPDDAPGTCKAQQATAVAKYIYDSFYSAEVRLRNTKPPRVELARLTNRQYLNSIADLLKEFTGRGGALSDEHGLRASYYSSHDLNGDKKVIERIDREIDFDFGEKSPDTKCDGTNGFSIQWRGSLKTDETGDYEFLLKTPNGSRLWVNDETEPLIDAWVASGQTNEHKAVLRLIGGRAYPVKLTVFKYKEKLAALSLQWKPPKGAQQTIPARNLSPSSTTPTFVVSTPFPADDSSYGYERGVSISKAWDEAATAAAIEVANHVTANIDHFCRTKAADTNRAEKIQTFCNEFVTAAFRRRLTQQQSNLCVAAQFKNAPKIEDAVKRVVLLTLKSPRFLYLGLQEEKPDDFAVAERLAYGLWDSLPDAELQRQAAKNALHTREQVAGQAERMIADGRAHAKMQTFFHHWLQMDRVENLSKDDKLFPGFTPAITADLRTSLNIFLENTMWSDGSDYRTLLLADYLFLNNRLAEFYEVNTNKTDEFIKTTFGSNQRSGVLTHPYLLAAFSYQKLTSPIHRGVFLTRDIVGRALKPPPMAMTFKDSDFAPNLTMREKVSQLTKPQNCQSCHSMINPLGFSLEQYDAVGRFRTSDHDRLIDPVSDYLTDDGQTIRLTGARDVAEFAINSDQAQNAFIQQLFHHVVKQPLLAYGADTLKHLRQNFIATDFNMQKLLAEIVTVSALRGLEKSPAPTVSFGTEWNLKPRESPSVTANKNQ
jgi:uncharacterized protein DUF1592/uncharacterized protein DUF1588/PA14 domain-containing protein/cbb3-type cytochrome c oxidase subunit III